MTAVTQLTMTPKTTLGRRKATQERAFVLNVGLSFRSQGVADGFIKEWGKAADYCMANEPFLFHYEVARSDKDPVPQPRPRTASAWTRARARTHRTHNTNVHARTLGHTLLHRHRTK